MAAVATLAVGGLHAPVVLAARAWETLVGGAAGLAAALLALPLRARPTGSRGAAAHPASTIGITDSEKEKAGRGIGRDDFLRGIRIHIINRCYAAGACAACR